MEDIFEYIALENPEAAKQVVVSIYERAQVLQVHPEIGYRYLSSERNVRILLYGHYRIAYLLKEDRNVEVLGVFHSSLDIDKYQL